jgi:parallel beta-helix repeat protein
MNKQAFIAAILLSTILLFPITCSQFNFVKADVISWDNCIVILPNGTLAETTQPVQADGDSYTLHGNTLTNNTQPIQRLGDTYTLTGDIQEYTLLVQRDNIVIDGANFTFHGGNAVFGAVAIYLSGVNEITIKNVAITRYSIGIQIKNSSGCVITNNVIGNPNNWYLDQNENGITITKSSGNFLSDNIVEGGGITVTLSSNNTFTRNKLYNGGFSVGDPFNPDILQQYVNSIDTTNTVDGLPVYYLVNQSNLLIDSSVQPEIGFLALINCNNITVKDVTLAPSELYVLFINTTNSQLAGSTIPVNQSGLSIILRNSTNNVISNNTLSALPSTSQRNGLSIWDSSGNVVSGNNVSGFWTGISITRSNETIISNNTITLSWTGIQINGFSNKAFGNKIFNTITATDRAVSPASGKGLTVEGSGNLITANIFENNGVGLRVISGIDNSVYQNAFINNTNQASVGSSAKVAWDNGGEGNYWSDYQTKYPNASQIGASGIGDMPYVIDENNTDYYPLWSITYIPLSSPNLVVSPSPALPTIAPTPSIPEFPPGTILSSLLGVIMLIAILVRKGKAKNT